MSQSLSDFITVVLTLITGFFVIYGIMNNYRDSNNKVTKHGKIAIWGGILSIALNLTNSIIKSQIDKNKAYIEQKRRDAQLEYQAETLKDIKATLRKQDIVLDSLSKNIKLQEKSIYLTGRSLEKQEITIAKQNITVNNIERLLRPFNVDDLTVLLLLNIHIDLDELKAFSKFYNEYIYNGPGPEGYVYLDHIRYYAKIDSNFTYLVDYFQYFDIRLNIYRPENKSKDPNLTLRLETPGLMKNVGEYMDAKRKREPTTIMYITKFGFQLLISSYPIKTMIKDNNFNSLDDFVNSTLEMEYVRTLGHIPKSIVRVHFFEKGAISTLFVAERFSEKILWKAKNDLDTLLELNKRYEAIIKPGTDFGRKNRKKQPTR